MDLFKPLLESLLFQGDSYVLFADFASYVACQERVSAADPNAEAWTKAILTRARMGRFPGDRTVRDYSQGIGGHNKFASKGDTVSALNISYRSGPSPRDEASRTFQGGGPDHVPTRQEA